jgi:L-ascorbate metabolism protein UlaG (beta-lactamase superfamily)
MNPLRITLIGGPTALIEIDGFRILTDPTFDAPGAYQLPHVKLEKLSGAAQTRGPFHLTMDTNDTIEAARAFPDAVIVPLHTDGWAHFRQNANDLRASFDTLGFGSRLKILEPGVTTVIEPPHHP